MTDLNTVVTAQAYIRTHFNEDTFCTQTICDAVGYSRRQLDRLFVKHTGFTLFEYVKAEVLSESAKHLLSAQSSVIDVAFDSHFHSHEGFSRSFAKRFSVTPNAYRRYPTAIPIFTQYPANHQHILKEGTHMEPTAICNVTAVERPKRKLIYLPSKLATDYLSYCEEVGCDWEGVLNSIPEKTDTAALLTLPDILVQDGFGKIASGVEVPPDYAKPLPEGYWTADLPPCTMLYFQSTPYENPDDFSKYIGIVFRAIEQYPFSLYGYRRADHIAPTLNMGAETTTGARIAIPVSKLP